MRQPNRPDFSGFFMFFSRYKWNWCMYWMDILNKIDQMWWQGQRFGSIFYVAFGYRFSFVVWDLSDASKCKTKRINNSVTFQQEVLQVCDSWCEENVSCFSYYYTHLESNHDCFAFLFCCHQSAEVLNPGMALPSTLHLGFWMAVSHAIHITGKGGQPSRFWEKDWNFCRSQWYTHTHMFQMFN